jgi:catechol 2,3-dioxygenase-like lactoylglutathione lyase family enzyme
LKLHTQDATQLVTCMTLCDWRRSAGRPRPWASTSPLDDPEFVIVAIHLQPGESTVPPRMAHFGYDLASRAAVDAIAAHGQSEGLLMQGPGDAGPIVGYFCMLTDPDGNLVEFSHGQPINPKHL